LVELLAQRAPVLRRQALEERDVSQKAGPIHARIIGRAVGCAQATLDPCRAASAARRLRLFEGPFCGKLITTFLSPARAAPEGDPHHSAGTRPGSFRAAAG